jgi:bacteriocin-like protein
MQGISIEEGIMNTSRMSEIRELTDDELATVSGGSLKDVADGLANALAPYAVKGWEITSVDPSRLATRLPPYN